MKILLWTVLLLSVQVISSFCTAQTKLSIQSSYLDPSDTLELRLWKDYLGFPFKNEHTLLRAGSNNGKYEFHIDIEQDMWMSLHINYQYVKGSPQNGILDMYRIAPNDSIAIQIFPNETVYQNSLSQYDNGLTLIRNNWYIKAEGRGSTKFMDKQKWNRWTALRLKEIDSCINAGLVPVDTSHHVPILGDSIIDILIANSRAFVLSQTTAVIQSLLRNESNSEEKKEAIYNWYQTYFGFSEELYESWQLDVLADCPEFIDYLSNYYLIAHKREFGNFRMQSIFDMTKERMSNSRLRDRVLTRLMMSYFPKDPTVEVLDEARETIRDRFANTWLDILDNSLNGRKVDFSLPDRHGNYHRLKDLRGKVVLMDFWYTACIPCRNYMLNVLQPLDRYFEGNSDVQLVTVSTDSYEVFGNAAVISDFLPTNALHLYTEDLRFKHPILKELGISGYPYPILLDKEGEIIARGQELKDIERVKSLIQQEIEKDR